MQALSASTELKEYPAKSPSLWLKNIHINLAICTTGWYVGTRYLRLNRDRPLLGTVHACGPAPSVLRVAIHCAEIAMCDNLPD